MNNLIEIKEDFKNFYFTIGKARDVKREKFENYINEKLKNYKQIPERIRPMFLEAIKLEYKEQTGEDLNIRFYGNSEHEEIILERSL